MALSMDEQRILAEIEQHLVGDDPKLDAQLTTFQRRPLRGRFSAAHRSDSGRYGHGRRVVALLLTTVCLAGLIMAVVVALVRQPQDNGRGKMDGNSPSFVTNPSNHLPRGQDVPAGAR